MNHVTHRWVPAYRVTRAPVAPPTQLDTGALRLYEPLCGRQFYRLDQRRIVSVCLHLAIMLRKELAAWLKKFPNEFYENIYNYRAVAMHCRCRSRSQRKMKRPPTEAVQKKASASDAGRRTYAPTWAESQTYLVRGTSPLARRSARSASIS